MKKTLILGSALLALAACEMPKQKPEPQQYGTLGRSLILTDHEGKRYGTVELDPVTGGRMFDVEGRQVGTIVTPAR